MKIPIRKIMPEFKEDENKEMSFLKVAHLGDNNIINNFKRRNRKIEPLGIIEKTELYDKIRNRR